MPETRKREFPELQAVKIQASGFDAIPTQRSAAVLAACREIPVRLTGARLYLTPFGPRHITPEYIAWFNDPQATQYTRHGGVLYTLEKAKAYFESIRQSPSTIVFAIHDKATEAHVGNISLNDVSWDNHSGEISIMIGERTAWGRGLGSEAVALVARLGFEHCQLHRLSMGMTTDNKGMIGIAKRVGFQEEGIRRQALFKNGTYRDITQWAMLNPAHENPPKL